MAGYSKIYVIGGQGGFGGADGVNPIEFLVLVGDSDRQWCESHYFNMNITPIGKVRVIVPKSPDHPDTLLDACIAFCPRYFKSCPSLAEVKSEFREANRLEFSAFPPSIQSAWANLREEARPQFASMNIWIANLMPIERT